MTASDIPAPILFVDDDDLELHFAWRAHGMAGLDQPLLALHGSRAVLDYLTEVGRGRARMPCAVLCDVRMPAIDGFELVEAVRAMEGLQTEPRIAFVTTVEFPGDRERARKLGCDLFVKPVALEDLASLFARILEDS